MCIEDAGRRPRGLGEPGRLPGASGIPMRIPISLIRIRHAKRACQREHSLWDAVDLYLLMKLKP
jgi:hypothetical protein